jgi:hypothetical protein
MLYGDEVLVAAAGLVERMFQNALSTIAKFVFV